MLTHWHRRICTNADSPPIAEGRHQIHTGLNGACLAQQNAVPAAVIRNAVEHPLGESSEARFEMASRVLVATQLVADRALGTLIYLSDGTHRLPIFTAHGDGMVLTDSGVWMTWATPRVYEVLQIRSPGPLHEQRCCDPELNLPYSPCLPSADDSQHTQCFAGQRNVVMLVNDDRRYAADTAVRHQSATAGLGNLTNTKLKTCFQNRHSDSPNPSRSQPSCLLCHIVVAISSNAIPASCKGEEQLTRRQQLRV